MTRASVVTLLILQSTSFCNIDCGYCYLPHRSTKKRMAEKVIEATVRRLHDAGLLGHQLPVCWHAGEPLTLPVAYYEDAIQRIASLLPATCLPEFNIQTNGTLINDDWCRLFQKYKVRVGVSIDGPPEFHDRMRRTRAGTSSFERTMRGIRHLQASRVAYHIICVLTRESLGAPDKLFDFFSESGIERICFNIEESEGIHTSELVHDRDAQDLYRAFYVGYLRRVRSSRVRHWVREIDMPFTALFLADRSKALNQQVTPFSIVTVDTEGCLSTFSPELIGMPAPLYGDFKFGNVLCHSIDEMQESAAYKATYSAIRDGIARCQACCEYFEICGGGAPSNKYFEHGSFDRAETVYCNLNIKTTANVLLEEIFSAVVRQ